MSIFKRGGKADMDEPPTRIRSTPLAQDHDPVPEPVAGPVVEPAAAPIPAVNDEGEPETIDMAPEPAKPSTEPMTTISGQGSAATASADAMDDPPAGFLVIVDGPGKGRTTTFGYGANTIGRATTQRVQLDFGDAKISRENHAQIIFDPVSRVTTLRHETGSNLTYVDGQAALSPMPLSPRSRFKIGDTEVMVIPLCDEKFDWDQGG